MTPADIRTALRALPDADDVDAHVEAVERLGARLKAAGATVDTALWPGGCDVTVEWRGTRGVGGSLPEALGVWLMRQEQAARTTDAVMGSLFGGLAGHPLEMAAARRRAG